MFFTPWYFYYIFIATFIVRKAINAPTHTFLETTTDEINTTPTFNEMCLEGFSQSSKNSNKCYQYFSNPKNWTSADFECQKYGGHLVSVHSSTENMYVSELIGSSSVIQFWLGGVCTDKDWRWIDNTRITYNNFANNTNLTENSCINFNLPSNTWNAAICNEELAYVCGSFAINCPVGSLPSIQNSNVCYKAYKKKNTWTSANAKCAENGDIFGQLASIHSYSDNLIITILTEHFRHDGPDGHGDTAWIGGLYNNNTAVWEWSDKSDLNYINWNTDLDSDGTCMVFDYAKQWQAEHCEIKLSFICSMFINFISQETSTTLESEVTFICPENTIQSLVDPSTCYIPLFGNNDVFKGAKELCEKENGTLPIIQNFKQNLMVTSLMNYDFDFWIGGIYTNDTWKWLNGNNFTYTNWDGGYPPDTDGGQGCVYVNANDGKWMAAVCNEDYAYIICEITAIAVTPEPTTSTSTALASSPRTTQTHSTTKLERSTFTSSIPFSPPPSPPNLAKWFIIGGILLILVVVFLVTFTWLKTRRQTIINEYLQENIRKKFLEATPLEMQLSHDERLKWQLNPKNVTIDYNKILGKGSNATVYEATIKDVNNVRKNAKILHYLNSTVALKLPTTFDAEETETFVRELDALIKLGSHSNIITFYGWSLFGEIPALITEEAHQNLLTYVKSLSEKTLPLKKFLSILWQISQALEHVAAFSMIHRDVACRNILLTEGNMAKLADFGLCCSSDESYRDSLQKRFPLKWLSIEALVEKLFSEKSDVWSFGVMCYEMFTFGSIPYQDLTSQEIIEFLQAHQRLEKPEIAPDAIYDLMLSCWNENPLERPCFSEISAFLRTMLEQETAGYGYLTLGGDILDDDGK